MPTVLITGAGGYAGGRLLEHLRKQGAEVVAGVRNRPRKLAFERQGIRSLVCDVADAINVARVVAVVRPDAVVHLAGVSVAADAAREPLEAYQCTVNSWAYILDGVRRAAPRTRVLLVSAADVYGRSGDDGRMLREDTPSDPVTLFGSLKALAEEVWETLFREYHLNASVARPFAYTGPGQPRKFPLADLAGRMAESGGGSITAPADWDPRQRCDLLHIDDVVAAYDKILWNGRPGEVYNVATGSPQSLGDLADELSTLSGVRCEHADVEPSKAGRRVACLSGDASKLRTDCGWSPTRTPSDAIRELWESAAASPRREPAAAGR